MNGNHALVLWFQRNGLVPWNEWNSIRVDWYSNAMNANEVSHVARNTRDSHQDHVDHERLVHANAIVPNNTGWSDAKDGSHRIATWYILENECSDSFEYYWCCQETPYAQYAPNCIYHASHQSGFVCRTVVGNDARTRYDDCPKGSCGLACCRQEDHDWQERTHIEYA